MNKELEKKELVDSLTDALDEGDHKLFLEKLRKVVELQGGMTNLAKKTRLSRGTLYKTISKEGNPKLGTLIKILNALKLNLFVDKSEKTL